MWLGVPLVTVVANSVRIKGRHLKDHHTKVIHPTCSLIMGSSIMAKPIQGNLDTHKDNPTRDNLRPLVVRLIHILGNILETQDNLMLSKDNLDPSRDTLQVNPMGIRNNLTHSKDSPETSKDILLGKVASLICSKASPLLSLVSHLVYKDNLRLRKDNQTPSKSNLLGK